MAVDVCSVYLADYPEHRHVLMATDGLNPAAVGRVSPALGEGVASVLSESAEPLNLDNAPDQPLYRFKAETGEEYYHGFLGVPFIHHRKVLGVLIVRQRDRRKFAEDEVAFLVTMAAQLAGAIAHAEASGGIGRFNGHSEMPDDGIIAGLAGAPGVGIGIGLVVYPPADLNAVPDRKIADVDAEIIALRTAVAAVQAEIQMLGERLSTHISAEEQALFDAYALMLSSESLVEKVIARIREGYWASGARWVCPRWWAPVTSPPDAWRDARSSSTATVAACIPIPPRRCAASTRVSPTKRRSSSPACKACATCQPRRRTVCACPCTPIRASSPTFRCRSRTARRASASIATISPSCSASASPARRSSGASIVWCWRPSRRGRWCCARSMSAATSRSRISRSMKTLPFLAGAASASRSIIPKSSSCNCAPCCGRAPA